MNPKNPQWWDHPDWLAFSLAVTAQPDDNTPRLIAADWLDEQGDGYAAARAEVIRRQITGGRPLPLYLHPNEFNRYGLCEPAYRGAQGLRLVRGWPDWAVILPQKFNSENVAPIFKIAPLSTLTTVGMSAYLTHEHQGTAETRTLFRFDYGPEDMHTGEAPDQAFGTDFRRLARAGLNPHGEIYRQAGMVPAPIFASLPDRGGAGGTRSHMNTRRREFLSCEQASATIMRAAWLCAWRWAGKPRREVDGKSLRTAPRPAHEAHEVIRIETDLHHRDERASDASNTPRTYPINAPSSGSGAWDQMPRVDAATMALLAKEAEDNRRAIKDQQIAYSCHDPLAGVSYATGCPKCNGVGFRITKPRKAGCKPRRVQCQECAPVPAD